VPSGVELGNLMLGDVFAGLGSLTYWYDAICVPSDAYVDVFAGFGSLGYWHDAICVPFDSNSC